MGQTRQSGPFFAEENSGPAGKGIERTERRPPRVRTQSCGPSRPLLQRNRCHAAAGGAGSGRWQHVHQDVIGGARFGSIRHDQAQHLIAFFAVGATDAAFNGGRCLDISGHFAQSLAIRPTTHAAEIHFDGAFGRTGERAARATGPCQSLDRGRVRVGLRNEKQTKCCNQKCDVPHHDLALPWRAVIDLRALLASH